LSKANSEPQNFSFTRQSLFYRFKLDAPELLKLCKDSIWFTCGWDDSEKNLPEEGEEVHDVVAASRHLLLGLLAFFSFLLVVVT
jgi:hypothetical protein